MGKLRRAAWGVSEVMDIVGGMVLTFMILGMVPDVILRHLGTPFTGTCALVYLGRAVAIAFAVPRTSREEANVDVDFVVGSLGEEGSRSTSPSPSSLCTSTTPTPAAFFGRL